MTQQPIRVLHVINSLKRGGAETLLLNYHRTIDRSRVQFDYLLSFPHETDYEAEVRQLGGEIFRIAYQSDSAFGKLSYLIRLFWFLLSHRYQIIHVHLAPQAALWPLLFAKILRYKHRIIHSHNTNTSQYEPTASLNRLKKRLVRLATDYYACSYDAGRFLYGEENMKCGIVNVLKSTIIAHNYTYCKATADAIRQRLNIKPTQIVLGAIARLEKQKNHPFMVEIMNILKGNGNGWILVLVGDGSLAETIRNEAHKLGVTDNIRMVGVSDAVRDYLSAFDLLLMPSLHEGMPLSALEAQAAGLTILASKDRVPNDTVCTDLVHFLPLEDGAAAWANWIANFSPAPRKEGKLPEGRWAEGYDAASAAPRLVARYEAMIQQA